MNAKNFLLGFAAVTLAGCQAPLVALHGPSWQPKTEYINDWNLLAKQITSAPNFPMELHPVYVAPGPGDMPFAAAFRTQLEQALLERGYPVVETNNGAYVLNFEVQTFRYNGEQRLIFNQAPFTTLAAGYGIATAVRTVESVDTGAAIAGVAGPALDILEAMNDRTNAEVLLTLRVTDGQNVHYLKTYPFYIQWRDLSFYATNSLTDLPIETASRPSPLAVVSMPIVDGR